MGHLSYLKPLHFSERAKRLDLNFHQHPLNPKFSNLHACPNRPVTRKDPLEVRLDSVKGLGHVDVVAAHGIHILPRQPAVDGSRITLRRWGYIFKTRCWRYNRVILWSLLVVICRPTIDKDVETQFQHNAQSPEESSPFVVERPTVKQSGNEIILHLKQPPKCISIGFSGIICEADEDAIVKQPKVIPNNDPYNQMFREMIINETLIYERLGNRNGIISYLGVHDQSTGAIRLAHAKQRDLERYIQSHDEPSEAIRSTWIQSLVETFWYIYSRKILHQDVKPNNILVENCSLKVADFANAAMYALDADMEEICVKDPLSRVDILGLGCIIYSIAAWQVFYHGYFEHDCCPEPENLPETSDLLYEDMINKCWRDSYGTLKSLYEDFGVLSGTKR